MGIELSDVVARYRLPPTFRHDSDDPLSYLGSEAMTGAFSFSRQGLFVGRCYDCTDVRQDHMRKGEMTI